VDLDQLRTAVALLQHRTVNRTAAALGVAASSVSDRIRRLETELGVPVFRRDRSGTTPTADGRIYLDTAAAALADLDAAAVALRSSRTLTVGAQASIADELLPAVLDELLATHPDLEVRLRPDPDRTRLLSAVQRGEIDAVVLLDTGDEVGDLGFDRPDSTMEHVDIRDVEMVVVAEPTSPLLARRVGLAEVRRSGRLIGREARCSFWMAAQRWLGPDADLTAVGGLAQVREWVARGRGIALLPEFAVRQDLATGRLAKVYIDTPSLQLRLIWLAGRGDFDPLRHLLYALTGV
jgi:DNA-binding transcriptional LysR family regulator